MNVIFFTWYVLDILKPNHFETENKQEKNS